MEAIDCDNCSRLIGKLETPRLWDNKIVCPECETRLREQARRAAIPPPLAYESTPPSLGLSDLAKRAAAAAERGAREVRDAAAGVRDAHGANAPSEEMQMLLQMQARENRRRKNSNQQLGFVLLLAGLATCCCFWPIGVPMSIVGLGIIIFNTSLW